MPSATLARTVTRRLGLLGVAGALLLSLPACRETEKNRPLGFTPHVYSGYKLPALTEKQTRDLAERGNLQR